MLIYDIIEKKRDGKELSEKEINFFVNSYTNGDIPDYQMSALLMAIYFQDMTDLERAALTTAMVKTGDEIDLSDIEGIKVDKHSTGGVGDTATLIIAPLVASLGVPVAKMSGRGLGHTGGTVDKLESVPGFHVEITNEKFIELVNENKIAVVGQSGNLTPADQKIYSLRDVTATVNSIPLIASSIMSKKIASGADAIVLDVKVGTGAFMKDIGEAKKLASAMVRIGNQVGRQTMAVISDMNQPLGNAIGNALEIKEAIATLQGKGPKDLTELSLILASQMVVLAKRAESLEEARKLLEASISNGQALERFKLFIAAQGGDKRVVEDPNLLPQAQFIYDLPAKQAGFVTEILANEIGAGALMLGAGRETQDSIIDVAVGIVLHKKIGDQVEEGESLLTIHANKSSIENVKERLYNSIKITNKQLPPLTLIHDLISF